MAEPQARGLLAVRGDAASAAVRAAAQAAIGVDLPAAPCTFAATERAAAYWLGPGEWLIAVAAGAEAGIERALRDGAGGGIAVADVSGGYLRFDLAGPQARRILMRSGPCDFHPRAFAPGRCVQTAFAKATALIACRGPEAFELLVRRSYADYVRRWLADARERVAQEREAEE